MALVFDCVAKEIPLGALAVIHAQADAKALGHALRQEITNPQAHRFMLFTLLHTPGLSTVAVIRSESRSRRFPSLSVLWSLLLAWSASFVFDQGARFLGWACPLSAGRRRAFIRSRRRSAAAGSAAALEGFRYAPAADARSGWWPIATDVSGASPSAAAGRRRPIARCRARSGD